MYKNLRFFITASVVLFSIISTGFGQFQFDSIVKNGIKKITKYQYKYKFGELDQKSKVKVFENIYDKLGYIIGRNQFEYEYGKDRGISKYKKDVNGKILEEVIIDLKGKILKKETNKFDEKGNKIEYVKYDPDGKIKNKELYKYDDNGNLIEEKYIAYYLKGKTSEDRSINKYDKNGNKIEYVEYDPDGNIDFKYIYKFNDKNNLIEENYYDSDGSMINFYSTVFDKRGNLIEENIGGDVQINESRQISYKYNEANKLIEILYSNGSEKHFKYNNFGVLIEKEEIFNYTDEDEGVDYITKDYTSYDDNGLMKSKISMEYKEDTLLQKTTTYYDKKERQIEIETIDEELTITKNFYKYDNNNNITEETLYQNGYLKYIISYKYDNFNNIIEKKKFEDDNWKFIFTAKYDESNLILEQIKYNSLNEPESKEEYIYLK